jgi:hypothetical protein
MQGDLAKDDAERYARKRKQICNGWMQKPTSREWVTVVIMKYLY